MIVPLKMARNFWLRSLKISYTPLVWTNEIPILVESHGNSGDSPDQVKKNTKQSWKHRLKLVKYGQIPSFADYINVSIFHHFPSFDAKKTPCLAENFAKSRWCLTSTHARPTIWPAQLGSDDGGRFFLRLIHPTRDWDPWKFRISGFLVRILDFQDMFRILGSMKVQQFSQLMLTWWGSMDVNWEFVSGPWNIHWNFEFSPMVGVWSDSLGDRGPAVRDKRDPGEHGTRIEMRKVEDSWRFVSGS